MQTGHELFLHGMSDIYDGEKTVSRSFEKTCGRIDESAIEEGLRNAPERD